MRSGRLEGRWGRLPGALAAALALGWTGAPELRPVDPARLAVEAGAIAPRGDGRFEIRQPGVRAIAPGTSGASARLAFTYLGPTRRSEPLASGELRRQIGLKLRARDTCNVVYVMWHLAPREELQVQVKANPDRRTHAECRDRGYRTLRPAAAQPPPHVEPGAPHALAARIDGRRITVEADGIVAWEGELPGEAFAFDGPAGLRTDNGEFDAELWAVPGPGNGRASR
jgi:hypothetical protein